MALGCVGLGLEDAMLHLLNLVFPNIFETSPHVINAVTEAIDGLRVALGPGTIMQYAMQGLFHPARKVREIYWKIYNGCYIGHQVKMLALLSPHVYANNLLPKDAMTAYYPRFEDEPATGKVWGRYELDYMI
jgi:splicing factor 3B subunit 1